MINEMINNLSKKIEFSKSVKDLYVRECIYELINIPQWQKAKSLIDEICQPAGWSEKELKRWVVEDAKEFCEIFVRL